MYENSLLYQIVIKKKKKKNLDSKNMQKTSKNDLI